MLISPALNTTTLRTQIRGRLFFLEMNPARDRDLSSDKQTRELDVMTVL